MLYILKRRCNFIHLLLTRTSKVSDVEVFFTPSQAIIAWRYSKKNIFEGKIDDIAMVLIVTKVSGKRGLRRGGMQ
ncbi:hypothetical protein KDA_47470 [Dictyobacter alpinus]|uniref:Uncharacterized protein n=1 Tax=Dictyobacter alpinus TaxID=2014873 RepID=A0A402BD02_9CHLR|nr:hypothetical protein KDA_47470 [Dictyobacter alpinus]